MTAKADAPATIFARRVAAGHTLVVPSVLGALGFKVKKAAAYVKLPPAKYVRLACQRHVDDLKRARRKDYPYTFNQAKADRVIRFCQRLHHSKGEWAGTRLILEPWQVFIVSMLFGWVHKDTGLRRFRIAYIEMGRKNGKSTLVAAIALYLAFFDLDSMGRPEPGAEVYVAATKRDQARIVWSECERMTRATPGLSKRITCKVSNLSSAKLNAKLEPLGADSHTADGLNIHGAMIDELHAHRDRGLVDVLETATGARRQPLQLEITTAGYDQDSICYEHREFSQKVLDKAVENPASESWFAFIAAADDGDDWDDPAIWYKANPNLGVSVKFDQLEAAAAKAREVPAAQNTFRRLHLCEWTENVTAWFSMASWRECNPRRSLDELAGRRCFGGLDLSSKRDITAFVLLFPRDEGISGEVDVLPWFWIPRDGHWRTQKKLKDKYPHWIDSGALRVTPGNAVDFGFIRQEITEASSKFEIVEIGFDPWGAQQLGGELLGDGAPMVECRQHYNQLASATKELERLILEKAFRHGDDPIMAWMASNVAVSENAAGHLKLEKTSVENKIDGIAASIIALSRLGKFLDDDPGPSQYESEELFTF